MVSKNDDRATGYRFEAGWYLPPGADHWNSRTPADIAERARLLPSEDFFAIVGLTLGQIELPQEAVAEAPKPKEDLWI